MSIDMDGRERGQPEVVIGEGDEVVFSKELGRHFANWKRDRVRANIIVWSLKAAPLMIGVAFVMYTVYKIST